LCARPLHIGSAKPKSGVAREGDAGQWLLPWRRSTVREAAIRFSIFTTTYKKEEKPMNSEQFKGNWDQFKGDLKKTWGKFSDDELSQIEGDYDKFKGRAQELYGEQKEELTKWVESWGKS
jgi:uncharacterized protein YjbJ (UPF0337 family)